ncbi:sulfur globule family protein [Streptomyces sp. XM83C]|uniref:Sulfur globule family protein n=2 Tax=Streptomyces thermocoprophilus TaxID=78356 RepID=A0ABV5VMS6_9ACTN|nr:sulfur globule family protein [Streptomyces sp. XM83C]MCK1823656.1 sulfur globule family protein [Streptomyces sp. XM83C]
MTNRQGRRWLGEELTAGSFLRPWRIAAAVFHPRWIPESLDPTVERLKRLRVIGGAVAALGVYTYVQGGFAFDEMLDNAVTASVVLFFLTPFTVGVMLFVWRRSGTVRQLKRPLFDALKLLLLFIVSFFGTVVLMWKYSTFGLLGQLVLSLLGLWLCVFVIAGAVKLSGNFFGTAVVHRCLPPLLATVTTWLMALSDLVTGDLHGMSLMMGLVFVLGAPVTVTAISLLEMRRLRSRYGIRLGVHPAALPPLPPPRPAYSPGPQIPPQGHPYPYGAPTGNPYGAPSPNPYGGNRSGNPYGG